MVELRKTINRLFFVALLYFVVSCSSHSLNSLDNCNVAWDSQSENSWGSMPIGNGDIGANVWVTPEGELLFYISKTDAWSENGRLLKIGKIKVKFSPNILSSENFRQELDLKSGMIKITGEKDAKFLSLNFWIDANHPAIYLEGSSSDPVEVIVHYDGWRTSRRELREDELRSAYGIEGQGRPVIVEPDTILSENDRLIWCHHNQRSIWKETMKVQALDALIEKEEDPLLFRTFGALVQGDGFVSKSPEELKTLKASEDFKVTVFVLTGKAEEIGKWQSSVKRSAEETEYIPFAKRKEKHIEWWKEFWAESYIMVSSPIDSLKVSDMTRGYQLQRYINACAGRGNMPIKFNGSIFNVDLNKPVRNINDHYDADFRDWGGCYWWQNTRLPYWSMLYSGDFEMMKPLFKMYMDALPLAKYRTKKYYGHEGACFPETMYFWGTWNNDNYGWDRSGMPDGLSQNQYIRYLWAGSIELIGMMFDYYDFTSDHAFFKETLLPFASGIIDFYRFHYKKGADGKIIIDPAQALETYWEGTVNPMPEIAGLNFVLTKFISFPEELTGSSFKKKCEELLSELPVLPIGEKNGKKVLLPAAEFGQRHNVENPELYAVFPYRIYGVGKPLQELAVNSFDLRANKKYRGWQQDAIQAALIGETEEAAKMVISNFNTKHEGSRFPAFWGPNYDWVPDQDHGTVNMRALQNMLIQTEGVDILLFPAWPDEWDVYFKFHAPLNTVIEGSFQNGKVEKLKVTPESRRKDIQILRKN